MSTKNKNLIFFIFVFFVLFLRANFIFALEATYPSFLGLSLNQNAQLNDLLCYVIGAITTITITLTSIVIALGGLYFIISYNRGSFTNEAKEWIKAGITGLLIVVCSSTILYTINPKLVSCEVTTIPKTVLNFIERNIIDYTQNTKQAIISTYQEIPIGKLTENLLTRTMDCFDFDLNGNPLFVEKNSNTDTKSYAPTFLDHDRADCFALLVAGSQKKAKAIADLSKKITELADQCDCEGKCNPDCGGTGCNYTNCPGGRCRGSCVGGSCNSTSYGADCCPTGIKDIIEHGPINPYTITPVAGGGAGECVGAGCSTRTVIPIGGGPAVQRTGVLGPDTAAAFQSSARQAFTNFGTSARQAFTNFGTSARQTFTNFGTSARQTFTDFSTSARQMKTDWTTASNEIDTLVTAKSNALDAKVKSKSNAIDNIVAQNRTNLDAKIAEKSANLDDKIAEKSANLDTKIAKKSANLDDKIAEKRAELDDKIAEKSAELDTKIAEASSRPDDEIRKANGKLIATISGINNRLNSKIGAANAKLKNALGNSDNNLKFTWNVSLKNFADKNLAKKNNRAIALNAVENELNYIITEATESNGSESVNSFAHTVNGLNTTFNDNTNTDVTDFDYELGYNDLYDETSDQSIDTFGEVTEEILDALDEAINQLSSIIPSDDTQNCESTNNINYNGLDEFRCPNPKDKTSPCKNLISYVEITIHIDGRDVKTIDKTKWGKLNLTQQMTYFKEKLDELQELIQKDKKALIEASQILNNCYLAIPSIDLIKNIETFPEDQRIILVNKTITDPITNSLIDSSKYCDGFGYSNSSCFVDCNNACPDTSPQAISNFSTGDCRECQVGSTNYADCINKQQDCVKNAYKAKSCISTNSGTDTSTGNQESPRAFKDCLKSCQDKCTENCAKKYLVCSSDYNFCKSQCKNNGQCLLNNSSKCLLNSQNFVACAKNSTDKGNNEYCFNKAYFCKNGSDEFAGYQDCAIDIKCSQYTNETSCSGIIGCKWDKPSSKCLQDYSSNFLFQYPAFQKCPNPLNSTGNINKSCLNKYPETTKCLSNSSCSSCPCDSINTFIYFLKPEKVEKNNRAQVISALNAICPTCANNANKIFPEYSSARVTTVLSQPISSYEMTGGKCSQYSYNGDPLTFYCMDNWYGNNPYKESSPNPLGSAKKCEKSSQIPIGLTILDAENWADKISYYSTDLQISIKKLLDKVKVAGDAKDSPISSEYCSCAAKNRCGSKICSTDCAYSQTRICNRGGCYWVCACTFIPCKGKPCQQLTDYLAEVWNSYVDFADKFININLDLLGDPKSDIVKKLIYSRNMTNKCSVNNTAFNTKFRMLNCNRIEKESISPANKNCFGQNMQDKYKTPNCMPTENSSQGNNSNQNTRDPYCNTGTNNMLTFYHPTNNNSANNNSTDNKEPTCYTNVLIDDWYCCQDINENLSENNDPIYNKYRK
jgi:hypothetical protein